MKIKYFILIIVTLSLAQEEIDIKKYKENGRLDALIDNYEEQILLKGIYS